MITFILGSCWHTKKILITIKTSFDEYISIVYQESNKVSNHFCYYTNVLDFYETSLETFVK